MFSTSNHICHELSEPVSSVVVVFFYKNLRKSNKRYRNTEFTLPYHQKVFVGRLSGEAMLFKAKATFAEPQQRYCRYYSVRLFATQFPEHALFMIVTGPR